MTRDWPMTAKRLKVRGLQYVDVVESPPRLQASGSVARVVTPLSLKVPSYHHAYHT